METVRYKDLVFDNLVLSKPLKIDGKYVSNLMLNKTEDEKTQVIIQTPGELTYKDGQITFSLNKKGSFYTFLEDLKERLVQILYNNSEKFFKGKNFKHDYIYRSVEPITDINEEGLAIINSVNLRDDVKVFDHFKDLVETSVQQYKGSFILHLQNVSFIKKSIKLDIDILAVKLDIQKQEIDEKIPRFLEDPDEEPEEEYLEEAVEPIQEENDESGEISEEEFFC